jgi:hypothetical protein
MSTMPRPAKVWMVPLGRTSIVEIVGDLRLEDDCLLFQPREDGAPETRLGFEVIAKVRRLRGSPVLMVTHRAHDAARQQTAFYFTQPPALTHIVRSMTPRDAEADLDAMRPSAFGMAQRRPTKRRSVRTNATYLAQEGTNRKRQIQEWVEEIRPRLPRS